MRDPLPAWCFLLALAALTASGGSPEFEQLCTGWGFTCARLLGGSVKCWGLNDVGQLGYGDQLNRGETAESMESLPLLDLGTGVTVQKLACGRAHACALLDALEVKCWGEGADGVLGLGDAITRGWAPDQMGDFLPAVDLGSLTQATDIELTWRHTCALLMDSGVKCWGSNAEGRLGYGDTEARGSSPSQMGSALPHVDFGSKLGLRIRVQHLSIGSRFGCAVLESQATKCWGGSSAFAYGDGSVGGLMGDGVHRGSRRGQMGDALPSVDLGTQLKATQVSCGTVNCCILLESGDVKCWGINDLPGSPALGLLGLGRVDAELGPGLLETVDLGLGRKARAIVVGNRNVFARLDNGQTKAWGQNDDAMAGTLAGVLGAGDSVSRGASPEQMGDALPGIDLGNGRTALSLSKALGHVCAVLDNSEAKCWGPNYVQPGSPRELGMVYGQLGSGDDVSRGASPGSMGNSLPAISTSTITTTTTTSGSATYLMEGGILAMFLMCCGVLAIHFIEKSGHTPPQARHSIGAFLLRQAATPQNEPFIPELSAQDEVNTEMVGRAAGRDPSEPPDPPTLASLPKAPVSRAASASPPTATAPPSSAEEIAPA